jgi:hypothetical protein
MLPWVMKPLQKIDAHSYIGTPQLQKALSILALGCFQRADVEEGRSQGCVHRNRVENIRCACTLPQTHHLWHPSSGSATRCAIRSAARRTPLCSRHDLDY